MRKGGKKHIKDLLGRVTKGGKGILTEGRKSKKSGLRERYQPQLKKGEFHRGKTAFETHP